MVNVWTSIIKRAMIGAVIGVMIMLVGTLGVTMLILAEVIDFEMSNICMCIILLVASVVSAIVSSSINEVAKFVQPFTGSIALLLFILMGNVFLNNGGPHNWIGTVLVVLCGGVITNLLKSKKNKTQKGNSRITKMVNLYKKQGG